jgi:ABC-2 type transport system ATP-binding protein
MTAIEVDDLQKAYGEVEAVRGVSFAVEPGEVFCLLGPNGAGKTTTTEVLEGFRLRTGGDVRVLGHDPARRERSLRERIGIVPQSGGLPSTLTVGEVLEMYARPYRRPRPVDDVVALVELGAARDTRVQALSGGQRRRLELGLGLVGDPDLLFLDEPTTGFDPHARRQAWDVIRSLCEGGKTVLLTTHFMDEAQALADRVAVMKGGRIVAVGPPAELGGRSTRPVEIRFRAPADVALPDLAGATVTRKPDGEILVVAGHGVATTHLLTGWALEQRLELPGFSVSRPTLEDVYLELTTA